MEVFKRATIISAAFLIACGSSGSGTNGTSTGGSGANGGTSASGGTSSGGKSSGGTSAGGSGGAIGGSGGAIGGSGGAIGGTGGSYGGSGGSAGGGTDGGATGGTGGSAPADITNCKSATDCKAGTGATCQIFTAYVAGYNKPTTIGACVYPIQEQTACIGTPLDECCKTADCSGGKCVLYPPNPECPDPTPPTPHNVCTGGSCGNCGTINYCIPPGAWGYKESKCLTGSCWDDPTCEQYEPGSKCLPVFSACGVALSIACVPPVIGCQRPSDCAGGKTCVVESGIAYCK